MINLPAYFVLGLVGGQLYRNGSHGMAGALFFVIVWLAASAVFTAWQRQEDIVQAILEEQGYA